MISFIKTEIDTGESFLNIYSFIDENLLSMCVKEIDGKLNKSISRKVGFFSDTFNGSYKYGNLFITKSQPLTPSMNILLQIVNEFFETDSNGILINEYINGTEFIHRHRDSKNICNKGVFIISYGATRNLRIFDNAGNKIKDVPLIHGQMLQMTGKFQEEFLHDLEKDYRIKDTRYSFNFHNYRELGI